MKRTPIFSLLLAVLFLSAMFADEKPDESLREKEEQARQLAQEVLAGRHVRVRVYNDWKKDPRAYKLVSIELDGLSFQCDAVNKAFGQMSESAVIVVTGEDQTDEAAAAVLQDFVYVEPYKYKKGGSLSVWPRRNSYDREESLKPCAFKDSLNNPIPNATVEIWMGVDQYLDSGPRVMIAKAKLDEAGLLRPPIFISSWRPSFIVHHPDCGPVRVIYVPPSSRDDSYRSFHVPALPKDKWCVFKDAIGNPISNATVEILKGNAWKANRSESLGTVKLDEKGRLKPPRSFSKLEWCCFIVSHPDYGTALAEPRLHTPSDKLLTSCTVPLVRLGTRADERSIWGTVVDPNSNPVAGALIECHGVSTPGGGRISVPYYNKYRTIADSQGRFAMYLPIEKDSNKHGNLIPLASKYTVRIEAPGALGLQSYFRDIDSGEENTITMVPIGYGWYFHTFGFEDEIGPIMDPNRLGKIRIAVKRDRGSSSFQYDDWKRGGMFPLGTYQARTLGPGGLRFEAIEVVPDSPTLLVFKVQEGIVYKGQVVHGISGKPMQGAIVMTGYAVLSGEDASSIEAEQWETLHALAALQESFDFGKITRADENGSFRISFTTGEDTYFSTFYALEKDYLCTSYHTKDLKPDNDRLVEVPAMRLFPAATLIIEPNLPLPAETNSHYDIRFRWSMDPNDNPPWLSDFWSYCHRVREVSVIYNNKLRPNTLQSIHVPAGLEMTARIFHVKTSQWCPIIIENIKLEQGRVLDLGRRDFEPAMKVGVRAVDSKGEPVEGVTVSCFDEDGFWGQKVITNENGTAFANVRPRSKGEFVVSYHDRVTETHLREGIPYEVGGEEDAGRQFTLQISDEMLYQLFK